MLLIFISWIYIVITTVNYGVMCDQILDLKNKNLVITSFVGLFFVTILASIWAIFGRINIEFHLALLLGNLIVLIKLKNILYALYKLFWRGISQLAFSLKLFLFATTLLILAKCSTVPYIIDNESYYIQTIKWINEYGFVKGLANLHLFFGQTSGWHITQSVFNFSFLYANFNDLSGYCLLMGTLFSVEKLNDYYQNNNFNYLLIGVFPLASLYLFQFISAPSPDLPIYVLSFVVLFYFVESYKNCSVEVYNLIVILVLFMLYIKITALIFALIPIILLLQNRAVLLKKLSVPAAISVIVLLLFIVKNMIVSGSALFPSKLLVLFETEYSIPKSIESNYYDNNKYFGNSISNAKFKAMSTFDLLIHWLSMPKINGILNKICLLLVLIVPTVIFKFQHKKSYWFVYLIMVFQLVLLLFTSPQYRFFMNFVLFFGLFCLVSLIKKQQLIASLLFLTLIPTGYLIFKPVQLNTLTNNKFMQSSSTFSLSSLIIPLENTKIKTDFKVIELGNLKYYSPIENDFFYGTGNGPLPCVNKTQIEYFKDRYNVIPQMRTTDLKDGFYSKKIETNE